MFEIHSFSTRAWKMKTLLLAAIAATLTVVSHPAFAVVCGFPIWTNVTLTSDLHCTGNALFITGPLPGAPNITIDLNGFSVTGDGTGIGISVVGVGGVTVKGPGRVSNFQVGLSVAQVQDVVAYDLTLFNNQNGIIAIRTSATRIFDNVIRAGRNGQIGVTIATSNKIFLYRNTITGHSSFGVFIPTGDPPDITFPTIAENTIKHNGAGIFVTGLDSDSIIRGNLVEENDGNGIEIGNIIEAGCTVEDNNVHANAGSGIVISGSGIPQTGCLIQNNLVTKNQVNGISIVSGVQLPVGTRVLGNRLSSNGIDLLWDGVSTSCFSQNVFTTSTPAVFPPCAL
jgi:parallel beta-helix repeat protein